MKKDHEIEVKTQDGVRTFVVGVVETEACHPSPELLDIRVRSVEVFDRQYRCHALRQHRRHRRLLGLVLRAPVFGDRIRAGIRSLGLRIEQPECRPPLQLRRFVDVVVNVHNVDIDAVVGVDVLDVERRQQGEVLGALGLDCIKSCQ